MVLAAAGTNGAVVTITKFFNPTKCRQGTPRFIDVVNHDGQALGRLSVMLAVSLMCQVAI